jgi:hypothetical protein
LNNKFLKITVVIVSVIAVLALIIGYIALSELKHKSTLPAKTPIPLISGQFHINQDISAPQRPSWVNVSQGTSFKVNLTLTSHAGHLRVNIQNLTITYYNSQVNFSRPTNTNEDYSSVQSSAFNYAFSPNPITVQPSMSNSTIITINLSQEAPIGQYSIAVKESVETLQSEETFKQEGVYTNHFNMIVY